MLQNELITLGNVSKKPLAPAFWESFFDLNVDDVVASYDSPNRLDEQGFQTALALFHNAAAHVPAYKNFLKKHGVKHTLIKTREDFRQVQVINKKNYLRSYPLHELVCNSQ